jgi:hypothetical protein
MALRYHDECINKHSLLNLCNGFICLRIGSDGGLLLTFRTFRFPESMQILEMNKYICARNIPKLKGSWLFSLRNDFLHLNNAFLHLNNALSANWKVCNDYMQKLVWL